MQSSLERTRAHGRVFRASIFANVRAVRAIAAALVLTAVFSVSISIAEGSDMETVDTPKVMTDKYVDTTSVEGIVDGLAKPGMSDQEKVIAMWDWYRRLVYHYRCMGPDRRELLRVINTYGYNLCGSQAATFLQILNKAGFPTRVMMGDAGEGFGGHTFLEVQYGGKWHAFDTMTSFFVYNRETPPSVAGLDETKKDISLVTKAIEEKRVPPGFLPCMYDPELTANDIPRIEGMGMKQDRRWATLTFEGGSLMDFWKKGARKWKLLENGKYNGKYEPGTLDVVLKPNEEYVRLWDNVGKWQAKSSYACCPPHHTCGHVDEHDASNFKYFEPYRKENFGLTKVCYRYYGNGWLEWKPDATAGEIEAAAEKNENLVRDGVFFKPQGGARGLLVLPVKSPYVIVEVEAEIESKGKDLPEVSFDQGKKPVHLEPQKTDTGSLKFVHTETETAFCDYKLKITAKDDAVFQIKRLKTTFQLNMYSLPGFFPGPNKVTVSAKKPQDLKNSKLVVTYDWEEGQDWKTPKSLTKEIRAFPASYEVEVAGPKMPRMKRLAIKLDKAASRPQPK